MKTLQLAIIALTLNTGIAISQNAAKKDPAQLKRVSMNYEIYEYSEQDGAYDIVINYDDANKTIVKGKLKDYDYLNYNSKTFASTDAIVKHYSEMITKAGGSLVSKSESIACSNEAGYHSGMGNGAVFKMKQNEKDTWLLVLAKNDGNYKLLMIE